MLALTLSGPWKWTGLRTSCRCAAPYLGWYCHRSHSVHSFRDRITSFQLHTLARVCKDAARARVCKDTATQTVRGEGRGVST